jgi:hypothetical protein
MEIDPKHDSGDAHLLYEARKRYPQVVADGLLRRVREGRTLFYGADDILAAAGIELEDDALCDIALEVTTRRDDRAEAAASVLGPKAVGRMIDAYLAARARIRDANGRYDPASGDRYHDLRARLHLMAPHLMFQRRQDFRRALAQTTFFIMTMWYRFPRVATQRAQYRG